MVADTRDTARQLVGLGTPLIIVLTEPEAGLTQRLVGDGHHVFAAYGPGASDSFLTSAAFRGRGSLTSRSP